MLTPEEAKKELEQHRDPEASKSLMERLHALRPELAAIGLAFLEESSPHKDRSQVAEQKRAAAKRALSGLDDRDRQELFFALFPPIADHVEASWRLQTRLPYQTGYLRKAFRAPKHPEYTANVRIDWVDKLLRTVLPYRYDAEFLAVWAAYLGWWAEHPIGLLLAGVLDNGHPLQHEIYDTLISTLNSEHEIARIGRYTVTALLSCSRPEAWAAVERLLLAAQRQEGLRQVVLESVDFAHPDAFIRMLQLIEGEKLTRFAAVARAVDVWFGFAIDSADAKQLDALLCETIENLKNKELRSTRMGSTHGQSLYLALWAEAFQDVVLATEEAEPISGDPNFDRRYPAVHFLAQVNTVKAARILVGCMADCDLRVAIKAAEVVPAHSYLGQRVWSSAEVFPALQELIERTPEEKVLEPAVWGWNAIRAKRADVAANMIIHRGDRPITQLVPYIPAMDADGRRSLLLSIAGQIKKRGGDLRQNERDLAISLLSDLSNAVRQQAFELLRHATLAGDEAKTIEPLLARKASDLRRGIIRLLLRQPAVDCQATIDRLARSGNVLMIQAADELRSETEPRTVSAASLQDGFGLYDPADRTSPSPPRDDLAILFQTPASESILQSLDDWIERHGETPVVIKDYVGQENRTLLGNLKRVRRDAELPLRALWQQWLESVKSELSDTTEVELARALCIAIILPDEYEANWEKRIAEALTQRGIPKFRGLLRDVLRHLVARNCNGAVISFLLDALEIYLFKITQAAKSITDPGTYSSWRTSTLLSLIGVIQSCSTARPDSITQEDWWRYWGLLRWIETGIPAKELWYPPLQTTLEAWKQQVASDADVYEQLFGSASVRYGNRDLTIISKRKSNKLYQQYPELAAFLEKCRNRILEVEMNRGELPTEASAAALKLSSVFGADLALKLLERLGNVPLARGYLSDNESKSVVFSHLLRVCLPRESDTPERFTELASDLRIKKKMLVDLAIYAPQWALYVEHATGIAGLIDAAYWVHAHTKDTQWVVDPEIRELWFAEVSERTPLTRQELLDGAVDIDWFLRMKTRLAPEDWSMILDAAKYASGGGGHKRAELFAATISDTYPLSKYSEQITAKRNQDYVRALGLLPLPPQTPKRRHDLLQRYELLQSFLNGSKKFGSQRQASEKLAYSIGLANLARTAGYTDRQRLSWAMESEAVADLRSGSVEVTEGGVKGVLSINAMGEPELAYERNGRALKDLPAQMRKSAPLLALRNRKSQLVQQSSRMRQSLEEAMIRGDRFTRGELEEMEKHPLLKQMISSILFAYDGGEIRWYGGLDGHQEAIRIAHPFDLLRSGSWPQWQQECVDSAFVQPFKQGFRELYLLTETEREQKMHSGRYSGQQINPKQAIAIAGKRGWVNVPEEGLRKTFHHQNVSVWVTFLEGWFTPADVDGLTVERILFTSKVDGKQLPLDQIDSRIFSEAMRDIDLVVSVAHRGGVDPEATQSTVEMRSALLRETIRLLRLENVRLNERYAFVDGKIGAYNVHLGSGTVHRQPGGALCIIPVHSQHRGRLFLPFADKDPKTAEIVSKVLLLSQDDKIKDPKILEQLR